MLGNDFLTAALYLRLTSLSLVRPLPQSTSTRSFSGTWGFIHSLSFIILTRITSIFTNTRTRNFDCSTIHQKITLRICPRARSEEIVANKASPVRPTQQRNPMNGFTVTWFPCACTAKDSHLSISIISIDTPWFPNTDLFFLSWLGHHHCRWTYRPGITHHHSKSTIPN